jgi:hypothetical protein
MTCPLRLREIAGVLLDGAFTILELRLESERSKGLFVLREVMTEHVPEGLGLLWAEIDALEVMDVNLFGGVLAHDAKGEGEVPDAHAYLDAVGVAFAKGLGLLELDGWFVWPCWLAHGCLISVLWFWGSWCERGDLNPHGLLRQILSLVRLPISPLSQLLRKTCNYICNFFSLLADLVDAAFPDRRGARLRTGCDPG